MHTIWKYVLTPNCDISMPQGSTILSIREQGDDICLWAIVNPEAVQATRRFMVYGTGHTVPYGDHMSFRGTAHLMNGALVYHVFEVVL